MITTELGNMMIQCGNWQRNGKLTCRYYDAYEADAQELRAEERARTARNEMTPNPRAPADRIEPNTSRKWRRGRVTILGAVDSAGRAAAA
jgi:hypothetical protein